MKHIASLAVSSLFLSIVGVAAGCGDNAEPDPMMGSGAGSGAGSGQTAPVPTAVQFPASCMDAGNGTQVADGEYTLYVGGDEHKPWKAWCAGGNEFLSVNDYTNYGEFTAGGHAIGTDVRTTYTKLRIDPQTLTIDVSDQTFATSVGTLDRLGDHITSMPVGVAMSCADTLVYGTAGMDLLGTPFKIVSTFARGSTNIGPAAPTGAALLYRDGQWMEAWASGECGFVGPSTMTGTPINKLADGWQIKVEWLVPTP